MRKISLGDLITSIIAFSDGGVVICNKTNKTIDIYSDASTVINKKSRKDLENLDWFMVEDKNDYWESKEMSNEQIDSFLDWMDLNNVND